MLRFFREPKIKKTVFIYFAAVAVYTIAASLMKVAPHVRVDEDLYMSLAKSLFKGDGFIVHGYVTDYTSVLYSMIYASLATRAGQDCDGFDALDTETRKCLYELFHPEKESLEIIHTTHTDLKFEYFFDGRYYCEETYLIGHHIFRDETGRQYRCPVIFGTNISNDTNRFGRFFDKAANMDRLSVDMQLIEATGMSLPIKNADGRVFYKTSYPLPKPGLKLDYVRFQPASVFSPQVQVLEYSMHNGE